MSKWEERMNSEEALVSSLGGRRMDVGFSWLQCPELWGSIDLWYVDNIVLINIISKEKNTSKQKTWWQWLERRQSKANWALRGPSRGSNLNVGVFQRAGRNVVQPTMFLVDWWCRGGGTVAHSCRVYRFSTDAALPQATNTALAATNFSLPNFLLTVLYLLTLTQH